MTFEYTGQAGITISDNAPALISVIHSKFDQVLDELNNLGETGVILGRPIGEANIDDEQVTSAKFNIPTGEIIADTDVVTKKYIDDNITLNVGNVLDSPGNVDSAGNPFLSIDSGSGTDSSPFIYHWYKTQSDGFLIVRSIAKPGKVRPWCAVLATKNLVDLENSKLGQRRTLMHVDTESGNRNEDEDNKRPVCVRGETYQNDKNGEVDAFGVRSLTVVLRKDEYFKIHCTQEYASAVVFKEAVWVPFGNGYKCVYQGLDNDS